MDRRRLVAADQQLRGAREVDVGEHETQRAGFTPTHRDGGFAIGRREHFCHAVALRSELRPPAEPACRAVRGCKLREDALQLDIARLDLCLGRRHFLIGVERDVADDVTVRDAEVERLEAHDAILQHDVGHELIDRYGFPLDARATELYVDVMLRRCCRLRDRPPPRQAVRRR